MKTKAPTSFHQRLRVPGVCSQSIATSMNSTAMRRRVVGYPGNANDVVGQQTEGQRRAQRHPAAQTLAQAEGVDRDERQQEDG